MSPLWTARELIEATGGHMRATFDVAGVSIDTRTLAEGDLFVALRGENGDGHEHVAAAFASDAAGAMVHRDLADRGGSDERLLVVDDTLAGLTRLGAAGRARFAGRLAAVTGSVGKTTTKEMLRTILSAGAPTHAAVASYNNHWGVPLTLARLPRHAAFCVTEIGMNHAGEIEPLSRLARPHVTVITAIAKAHVGHLGSIEAIADEKASVMRGLEPEGVAVLPADSSLLARLRAAAEDERIVTFGSAADADLRLLALAQSGECADMTLAFAGRVLHVSLAAPGRHMAMNALAALAAASALGIAAEDAASALSGFAPVAGRGARRRIALAGGAALLLDESYNGNGASMRAALNVLALQPAARRVAILGDMLELGEEGPAEHATLAPDVEASADVVFTCGPLMRRLHDALPARIKGAHAADAAELAPVVARAVRPGDAILVKGSLGSRMKLVVSALDQVAEAR